MRVVLGLAVAQLRHHAGRWALVVVGLALVVAVPVVAAGTAASAGAETVRRTVAGLDLTERTLFVSQEADSTARHGTPRGNDHDVRAELGRLTTGTVLHEVFFRELTVSGTSLLYGGVDRLAASVRPVSGRLPRSCTPTRCEVVVLGGADTAALRRAAAALGAVVVGTGVRRDPLIASGALDPRGVPVLLADGVERVTASRVLDLYARHYAWAAPVDPGRVVALGTPRYVARSADVAAALDARVGGTTFERPDDALLAAQGRVDASVRRFGLLGGVAAVLLVGFALVAAVGLRREARLLAGVLDRRGATRAQGVLVVVVQVLAACLLAAGVGLAAGAVGSAVAASGTGRGVVGDVARAVASSLPGALVLLMVAGGAVVAVLLAGDARTRAVWRSLDLLALACVGAMLLAAGRGSATTGSSGDPLVVALPVLAATVAGIVAARSWAGVSRVAERALPRSAVAARIGLLGAIRRPLRPAATVAFLTAAVTSVVFAGSYRATLLANDADQAAYRVPLDATVTPSASVLVPTLAPDALGPGTRIAPVLRSSVAVTRLAGVVASVPLVGVDAEVLPLVHRWARATGSDSSAAAVADRLAVPAGAAPVVAAASSTTQRLTLPATGVDPQTELTAWLRTGSGRELTVLLARSGRATLAGTVPALAEAGALRLVAVGVSEGSDHATHHAHNVGEGSTDQPALSGRVVLGVPAVAGAPVAGWSWVGWGSVGGTVGGDARRLSLTYRLTGEPVVAAAGAAAIRAVTLPVVVDPDTAGLARGGVLRLVLDSTTTIRARVVATMARLPTVQGAFVLADRAALERVLDLTGPGRNASEYWVQAPATALTAAATGPLRELTVSRRDLVAAQLDSDPIARASRVLLAVVALLALAVAALALVLLVVGERRDGAGELYAWEADGLTPRALRRVLVVRVLSVVAVGLPVGVIAGVAVARAATGLIALDAAGSQPVPPLEVTLGSVWTVVALAGGLLGGLVLAVLTAAGSLRERHPVAAEADLR